jgi:RNA polymerase sigma factor (sigma-70 family)
MTFPQTRLTLIQRLASGGSEQDWQSFINDYWGPVFRFSLRRGAANPDDAEDVAAQTFEVLWENRLLVRWESNRSAKLRTLLCSVVRKLLANRRRGREVRDRKWPDIKEQAEALEHSKNSEIDAFYADWVEDIVGQAVESLAGDYLAKGQGDYVRVLYGRLCEQLTIAEVAQSLEIKPSAVDHCFRHARTKLADKLREQVRRQVGRYVPADQVEDEFAQEWHQIGRHLAKSGGLEDSVRRAFELIGPHESQKRRQAGLTRATQRLTSIMRLPQDISATGKKT